MEFPSKEQIEPQILKVLASLGGQAHWKEVAANVAQHFKLDEEALSRQTTKAAIRQRRTDWQVRFRTVGLKMPEITRRGGRWTITEKGQARLRQPRKQPHGINILVIHGPNLNLLGKRDASLYGTKTLKEINALIAQRARKLGAEVACFQSNWEGALVDFLQEQAAGAGGIIINPGALTHYGLSLREALADTGLPVIEVHLSNIYAREEWRHHSVITPIARGQISGLGWQGYILALEFLVAEGK